MTLRRAIRYYLTSKTNIILLAVCAAVAAGGLLLASGALIPAFAVAAYLLLSGALLFSRSGAKAIVTERDQRQRADNREKIQNAAAIRDRIRMLRIPGDRVKNALEYYLLVSGTIIAKAETNGWHDPRMTENLDRVLATCSAYLSALDGASTAARYGAVEGDPADVGGSSAVRDAAVRDAAVRDAAVRDAEELIRSAARELNELKKIELPDAVDLDTLIRLEERDIENDT